MISFATSNVLNTSRPFTSQASLAPVDSINTQTTQPTETDIQRPINASEETQSSNNRLSTSDLTEEEQRQVEELRQRDREVRAHEQAHAIAAGSLANGGPSYEFQTGPDGRRYAVGGSVDIDTSPVAGDPEATLEKAQQIQRAALAPAEPSSQDRAVAAEAAALAAEARAELAQAAADNVSIFSSENDDNNPVESFTREEDSLADNNFCAECGGRHSSDSHNITEQIESSFAFSSTELSRPIFEISA